MPKKCQTQVKYEKYLHLDYFRFTFVRNPWDRAVSSWAMINEVRKLKKPFVGLNELSFEDFLELLISHKGALTNWEKWHVISQSKFIYVEFSKIYHYETLQSDFDDLCDHLNLPRIELSRLGATIRKPYREYYTPQTKDIVGKIYKADIERFGYEF